MTFGLTPSMLILALIYLISNTSSALLKSCLELKQSGVSHSGVYSIKPDAHPAFNVYCDQSSNSGGWTVIQRRFNGSEDFNRSLIEYQTGFGHLTSEFWLGTIKISQLTSGPSELLIELENSLGQRSHAFYRRFRIADGINDNNLSLSYYTGTAGDAFGHLDQMYFSAPDEDRDNDTDNCARKFSSGWWYKECTSTDRHADLNGPYQTGIYWSTWDNDTITSVSMKVRPVQG